MRSLCCWIGVVAFGLGLTACATTGPNDAAAAAGSTPPGSGTTSDGALLTLEERDTAPVWRDWQPRSERTTTPSRLADSVDAFDYWEIDDPEVVGEVWSALFPVLDAVRTRSEAEAQRKSMQLLLEAIEPGREEASTRMDLTFVVSDREKARFEGFACRLYRRLEGAGVTPMVTILFIRRLDRPASPDEIWVWGAPGFREPDPVTALFRRTDSRWQQAVVSGLAFPKPTDGPELTAGQTGEVAARVLTDSIWKRFAGNSYLSSPQSGAESERRRPDDVDRALGLSLRDRRIREVYSDTEFPPRADLEDL